MQGERSSISTMAENVSFDHRSSSSDMGTDSQLAWNSMRTPAQNRLPDYRLPSNGTNTQYLQHVTRDAWSAEWTLGESSAPQHQYDENESKVEHIWTFDSHAHLSLEEHQNQPSNILTLEHAGVNSNGNQRGNGSIHLQSSSYALNQDLNVASGCGDQEDDGHQGVERLGKHISVGSSSEIQAIGGSSSSFGSASGCGGHMLDNGEDRMVSLDGRRMPCKRKAIELNVGQSSGAGSSNCFQNSERSHWNNIHDAAQIPVGSINVPTPPENNLVTNNGSDPENSRLRLGVGGAVSASPFSLTAPPGNATSSHRNCRMRIGLQQEEPIFGNPFAPEADVGSIGASSSQYSESGLGNGYFNLNPSPAVENGNLGGQSVPFVPSTRQNHQSGWTGPSTTRASSLSSAIQEEWSPVPYEEPAIRNIPRRILEHPMFITACEMGNSSQNPDNWNSAGANNHVAGNFTPLPRVSPSTATSFSASSLSHRNPRRLSDLVRRSLLPSTGTESGSQSGNPDIRLRSFAPYHEMALPHRSDNHRHRAPGSRPLLDRHGALAIPYSLRTLAAASEGRSSVMSEQIRHVLDLMRRGEGLRPEDVMILDHSVFAGMADIHDRHRDMRLDVDNMSYEELLALEERIGNVCTGLSEETIISHMKQHKYVDIKAGQAEMEPCSICREEYNAGEDIGALDCGHEFHQNCIKRWLLLKNLCPICKTTGLAT